MLEVGQTVYVPQHVMGGTQYIPGVVRSKPFTLKTSWVNGGMQNTGLTSHRCVEVNNYLLTYPEDMLLEELPEAANVGRT